MTTKRSFLVPFIAALIGGALVAAVIAAAGGLNSGSKNSVTTVQAVPVSPTNASQRTIGLTPHQIYERALPASRS